MTGLTRIWKDRNIQLTTKVKLVNALVFPVVMYGCESWVLRKEDRRRIDAFELWCWRRLLRIPWVERRTNTWVLNKVKPQQTLESRISNMLLKYTGHVMRADGSLEKDILTGKMEGRVRRGRPRMSYWDKIKELSGMKPGEVADAVRDRNRWRKTVDNVTRGRPRLDGTR